LQAFSERVPFVALSLKVPNESLFCFRCARVKRQLLEREAFEVGARRTAFELSALQVRPYPGLKQLTCRIYRDGSDGTRTRDLRRDRPAF
jgi:hypothetical protein